jgi:putative tryptophan/tyrosine transport system substrate-binding protein
MFGIVANLNRPGINITGITLLDSEVTVQVLGFCWNWSPQPTVIGGLANPNNPISKPQGKELQAAAHTLGRQLLVFKPRTESDFSIVFAAIDQQHVDVPPVAGDPFFDDRRAQLVSLAAGHKVPACYIRRGFVMEGGLVSDGPDVSDAFRQAGIYTGRILKGEKGCRRRHDSTGLKQRRLS